MNGGVSFWWQQVGRPTAGRDPLPGPRAADVCIVGAGYTGLWTAYYLKRLQPDLDVVVLEARFAGYGASGRNGGWLTNSVTGGRGQYVRKGDRSDAIDQQRALDASIDEVAGVVAREGIEAGLHRGGELVVATNRAQLARLRALATAESRWPGTDVVELTAAEAHERVGVDGVLGGLWHPHCATIHPARLVTGLAEAVERLGVTIHESTAVTSISPGVARTERGDVRARHVLRATEGFTPGLRGHRRTLLPMNSSMIVTEPLAPETWDAIGWRGREALGDLAHAYMYAQRTADGRIALGGRGVPYRFGSRTDRDGRTHDRTVERLTALLHTMWPVTADVAVEHAWCGVLGVPRDWAASVGHDATTGLGWAGGYVGTGVTATNLAGRTLADLVLARDTELTRLPWVGHRSRGWEPEPLRWLGVQALYRAYYAADRQEHAGRAATAPLARVADRISGRG